MWSKKTVLPVTIPMLKLLNSAKVLHLEPTDVCQAACPLCARETDINFDITKQHHLSMFDVIQAVGVNVIEQLDKMFMCGNYGDPAAGRHTLDIYKKVRTINPDITLGMNTNGALRNANWWTELANIFNQPRDYVVFSIDGLEDTNHVYRKNVDWKTLMANVESFILAGGHAHWDMLVYRHNEHQVDQCAELAKSMGFKWFRAKVSKRALVEPLEAPVTWQPKIVADGQIVCHAEQENSVYLDAQRRLSPCCWLAHSQPIDTFDSIRASWASASPNPTCSQTCRQSNSVSSFTGQWQKNIEFEI